MVVSVRPSPTGASGLLEGDATGGPHRLATAGVLAVLVAFACYMATRPFGQFSVMTALTVFSELFAASWDEFGFLASGGVPMASPLGETVVERDPYVHQAPIGWWHPYVGRTLFGKTELGYKLFSALFTAAGAFLVFRLVRRAAGLGAGLAWVLLFLTCPVVLLFAALPGIESISLLAAAAFVTLWMRYRQQPTRRRWVAAAVAFLAGCQCAWSFYFMAPGLLLSEILRPPGSRRLQAALLFFPLGVAGFLLVVAHLMLGTGSPAFVLEKMFGTALEVFTRGIAEEHPVMGETVSFAEGQLKLGLLNLGPLGAALTIIPVVAALASPRWRRDPLTPLGAIFLVQGVLTVVLFNARSNTHGYYWFLMSVSYGIFLVQGARMAAAALSRRFGRRTVTSLVTGALAVVVVTGIVRVAPEKAITEREGLEEIARSIDLQVGERDWICCLDGTLHGAMLYSKRRWTPPIGFPRHLDALLEARRTGRLRFERLFVVIDPEARRLLPELCDHLESLSRQPGVARHELPPNTIFIF